MIPAGLCATPVELELTVATCSGGPLENAHVVLVGEQVAENLGAGGYLFKEVPIGKHRLLVYYERGTVSDKELDFPLCFSHVKAEIMIDTCIETQLSTLTGRVINQKGKPVLNADVMVSELFLKVHSDSKGVYSLDLPPGKWRVSASSEKLTDDYLIELFYVDEGYEQKPVIKHDFRLE